jgi:NADH-quinone oxidoreductase subunit E
LLTDAERAEIEEEVRPYPQRRAGCLDALKVVQKLRGWVGDEEIGDLAAMLDMSREELDSIATFYPFVFRRPVGRHVISVCDSLSCWVMGYEAVLRTLTEYLGISWGGTTEDGRFTLLPASCIGQCDHAPAIMVDRDVYGDLTAEKIRSILDQYA